MDVTVINLCRLDMYGNPVTVAPLKLTGISQSDSYILKGATGLDADEIMTQFYGRPAQQAPSLNKSVLKDRSIKLLIELNPNYALGETVSGLRAEFYKMLSYTRLGDLQLRFYNGATLVGVLYGNIGKLEGSIFSSDKLVQITFDCKYPLIKDEIVDYTTFLTDDTSYALEDNVSTAAHGFELQTTLTADVSDLTIQNLGLPIFLSGMPGVYYPAYVGGMGTVYPEWVVEYDFLNGDDLYIGTDDINYYVYIIRALVKINLIDHVVPNSIWPVMMPGSNSYGLSITDFSFLTFSWYPTHWGL